ncbi:MAG TPA: ribbon-helix-helix protein, CopG family [Verrucomicrobiae bacterium]|nr:ribbon-helix-helix protein, CopG family [Verrucomicrobiae bacterium]
MAKTKKTMIYLGEVDHTRLKYMALDDGVSMAELIRQAIAQFLKARASRKRGRK